MKNWFVASLLLSSLYIKAETCPKPTSEVASLFKMIESTSPTKLEEIQNYLHDHIIPVDSTNEECETIFHAAIENKENELFKYLFKSYNQPDVNQIGKRRRSIYEYALQYGNWTLISYLKNLGGKKENEFVFVAAYNDHLEVIKEMIKAGANVNEQDQSKRTALINIVRNKTDIEFVKTLIKAGSDVNLADNRDSIALHHAATRNKNIEIINYLIQNGSDINKKNNVNITPLMEATAYNNLQVVELLIRAGANINDHADDGYTPLLDAAQFNSDLNVLQTLIRAGAETKITTQNGMNLLMVAASNSNPEILKFVLGMGFDVNFQSIYSVTPLMAATYNSTFVENIKILLEAGANVNLRSDNQSAIFLAVIKQNVEFVELLLKAGARVDFRDQESFTVMDYALGTENKEIITLLKKAGAKSTRRERKMANLKAVLKTKMHDICNNIKYFFSELGYWMSGN